MGCGIWDLDGHLKHNFCDDSGKLRANDLAVSPDGQRLVVATESSIVVFDFVSYERIAEYQLDDVKLTSVSISQDSRHMLVSMNPDQIKLMEIDSGESDSAIRSTRSEGIHHPIRIWRCRRELYRQR